jgi:beta-lactamase class A
MAPQKSDPLAAAGSHAQSRTGTVEAAVYDLTSGQTWTFGHGTAQDEASIVKVNILEALLAQSGGHGLSTSDQTAARRMIKISTNDAATELWNAAGATAGITSYDASVGMAHTTPSSCVTCPNFPWPGWGLTTTTPSDQLALLRQLVQPSHLLTDSERSYALGLMEQVTASERWGVSAGVPTGVTVALKNGWLPLNTADTDWQVNSIGWVSGKGRNYIIAVLTTGDPTEQYGIDTINQISTDAWAATG